MNTDNHRSVCLHFVFMGWVTRKRMGYDGHVPIVLIHLSLASGAIAEDSRSRYVSCETRSAISAVLLAVLLMLGVCDKVL